MSPRARSVLESAAVAIAAVLVYINALANRFAFDDVYIIEKNARVHQLADLSQFWSRPYWPDMGTVLGLYRPLTVNFYAVQWAVWGGNPLAFHAVNIALHAMVSVLVLLYLRELIGPRGALAGALVFAVHPVHTEAVANVVGQAELLAALGVLGACLIHGHRLGQGLSWGRLFAIACCYLGAIASKESAIVLPALLVLGDFVQRRVTLSRDGLRSYVRVLAMPLFILTAVAALFLALRVGVLGSIGGSDPAPSLPFLHGAHRVLVAFRAWPEFARLLFFPLDLSSDYAPGVILPLSSLTPMALLGLLLLGGTVALAALVPWRPGFAFPAAWFLITVLPVSNLFLPIGVVLAERTLYLPSVAVAFCVAGAWRWAVDARRLRPAPVAAALGILLFLLGMRAWIRNPDWHDTITVVRAVARDHPESYHAQWALATNAWAERKPVLAELYYRAAYRLWPDDSELLAEWGKFALSRRDYRQAATLLERAYRLQPGVPAITDELALADLELGRYAQAERLARAAFRLDGPSFARFVVLAGALEGQGRFAPAAAVWRAALRRSPGPSWLEYAFLARALARAGRPGEAVAALDSARTRVRRNGQARTVLDAVASQLRAGCFNGGAAGSRAVALICPDPLDSLSVLSVIPPPQTAKPSRNTMSATRSASSQRR